MNRIEILTGFLKDDPNDSFSRYALALEYIKKDQREDARREFETVRQNDPNYVATYLQLGQLYRTMGLDPEAGQAFRDGIAVARKSGDSHTEGELQGALEALSAGS
jgi:Tfp pilus assembly protein PilF